MLKPSILRPKLVQAVESVNFKNEYPVICQKSILRNSILSSVNFRDYIRVDFTNIIQAYHYLRENCYFSAPSYTNIIFKLQSSEARKFLNAWDRNAILGQSEGLLARPVGHFCILRIKIDKDTICVPCTGKNCFCLLILIQITLYYVAERRRGENFLRLWVSDTTFKHFEKFVAPTPVQKYLEQAIGHNNIEVYF